MPNNQTNYYYTAREVSGGWIGIVYHYDFSGEKEKHVFNSQRVHSKEAAIELAEAWADLNLGNIRAELE